jgi:hypothetical protein
VTAALAYPGRFEPITSAATAQRRSYSMRHAHPDGWDVTRFALAALWVACFVGPMVAYQFRLAVVPIATLFVGWTIWSVLHRPSAEPVTSDQVA